MVDDGVLCHSAFVRVATTKNRKQIYNLFFATAHSCGLRRNALLPVVFAVFLCHSAFVRVATLSGAVKVETLHFATAHSCGLRHSHWRGERDPPFCHSAFVRVATAEKQCSALRICCEKVDSFSSVGESGLALTIFPFSFAAKATYVAINDSFGRAIDRFFGANRTGISVSYDFAEHPCL